MLGKGVSLCGGERKSSAGMGGEVGGECIAQPAGVRRAAWGAEVLGEGVSLCGAGEGLRRGMGCAVGGECIAQSVGVRRGCVGERKCSARACRCAGASEGLRRRMGCAVGGEGVVGRRGMHRAACRRASGLRGGAEVLGKGVSLCGGGKRRPSAGNGW